MKLFIYLIILLSSIFLVACGTQNIQQMSTQQTTTENNLCNEISVPIVSVNCQDDGQGKGYTGNCFILVSGDPRTDYSVQSLSDKFGSLGMIDVSAGFNTRFQGGATADKVYVVPFPCEYPNQFDKRCLAKAINVYRSQFTGVITKL